MKRSLKKLIGILLLFIFYVSTAKIGLSLDPVGGFAALVWAPSGIALAAILIWGISITPGIFLGAWVINVLTGAPILVALSIAVGNSLGAIVGAFLLTKVADFRNSLERIKDAIFLIIFGGIISPTIAATVGTLSLILGGVVKSEMFFKTWLAWCVGDTLGILVVTPLILVWSVKQPNQIKVIKIVEFIVVYTIFLYTSLILFRGFFGIDTKALPLSYTIFPVLIWLTLRFSQREVITIIFLLSVIAIWGTMDGYGTFARTKLSESLLYLQSFIGITTVTFLLFSSEITEKKALEKRKDEFISIASHELKTPITTLKGYVQIISLSIKKTSQKKLNIFISKMDDQLNRLTNSINQMLDSSRIGEGKLTLNYELFDISLLTREVVNDINHIQKKSRIIFDDGQKKVVEADKYRIRQVLENLISNATKFSSDKVIVKIVSKNHHVTISVKDFGDGIDAEFKDEIFTRFFQIRGDLKENNPGLGLGLYICAGIIKLHNGLLWVKSKKGKGSTFYFSIPVSPR